MSCGVTSTEAEVKGRRSERARDNSIKVLVGEERRRWQQEEETLRSAERNTDRTHSHFRKNTHQHFFSWPLDEIGFSTTWIQLESKHGPLKPAEGPQEAGSTGSRKYRKQRGLTSDHNTPTLASDYLNA